MADLVFPVTTHALPADHAWPLQQALCAVLPWLQGTPAAGVHQIRLASSGPVGLVSARARLMLRLPQDRLDDARVLAGRSLDIAGHALQLGEPHVRALVPHGTLYAHAVASDGQGEEAFMRWVQAALLDMELRMAPVCGKGHARQGPHGRLDTFSLMVHGLQPSESLLLLQQGLGPERLLGCGLFVAHKSASAVGA